MQYGFFDDEQHEYIITRPATPLPWINYLGCEDYFGIISNTAGGYSFYKDARLRGYARYRYNNVSHGYGRQYIYLRENDPRMAAHVPYWSPTWQRSVKDLAAYACHSWIGV
jgi:cellobiose phosphorylase